MPLLVALSTPSLTAQASVTDELKHDLVAIEGDSLMVITSYRLDKLEIPGYTPAQMQVSLRASAPVDGPVSRDYFVTMTTLIGYVMAEQVFAEAYNLSAAQFLEAFDTEELESLIGEPDLSIDIVFADGGLQISVKNHLTGDTRRSTQTWDEFLDS